MNNKSFSSKLRKVLVIADLSRASRRDFLSGFFNAVDSGCNWNMHLLQSPDDLHNGILQKAIADGLDGIVILENWDSGSLADLESSNVSIVAIGAHDGWFARKTVQITFLRIDDEHVGAAAAEYFARHGTFNSYVFLPAKQTDIWSCGRETGFHNALARHNISAETWDPDLHGPLAEHLKRLEKPIAVFAACDRIAANALAEIQQTKLSVPSQVSILGVDDDKLICNSVRPHLSSIKPGHYDEGLLAARELNVLMNARKVKPRHSMLYAKTDIIERASTTYVAPAARILSEAKKYIEENATLGISPNDVAKHLGISRRLLDLRFGELSDTSVADLIRKKKLDTLKAELKHSSERLSTIGRRCGFPNATYLKKLFLSETGQTLSEWRAKNCH